MTNDEFDDLGRDERVRALVSAHYNPPSGAVPRDAMWATVRAARQAERAAAVAPVRTIRRAPWRWAAALAAGLLLGVALGRATFEREAAPVARTIASRGTPSTGAVAATPSTPERATSRIADDPAARTARPDGAVRRRSQDDAAPTRVAAAERATGADVATSPLAGAGAMPDARGLYRAAAVQTIVQAEALLTAYRRTEPSATDAVAMRQTARWSREVLSSTRLLLDSPAGRDPQLRALLTDLELVLAQIVQLSGAPLQAGERELIERAMHDRDLLPRLRSVVPAGVATT